MLSINFVSLFVAMRCIIDLQFESACGNVQYQKRTIVLLEIGISEL